MVSGTDSVQIHLEEKMLFCEPAASKADPSSLMFSPDLLRTSSRDENENEKTRSYTCSCPQPPMVDRMGLRCDPRSQAVSHQATPSADIYSWRFYAQVRASSTLPSLDGKTSPIETVIQERRLRQVYLLGLRRRGQKRHKRHLHPSYLRYLLQQ